MKRSSGFVAHALDGTLQAFHEERAIGETGELVALGGGLELGLERLASRDVLHDRPDEIAALTVGHAHAAHEHRIARAVLAHVLGLVRPVAIARNHGVEMRLLEQQIALGIRSRTPSARNSSRL